jgi:flagellar biosynthesis GTPase FlhF
MAEREDWLVSKMTRAEVRELSDVDKKERKRLKKNISGRKYREENPEYGRKYREENKEKFREKNRKYREENPEYYKKYYEENTEHMKETHRKYKEENPEYDRKYYQENTEYFRQYRQSPTGKKSNTISCWVNKSGLQESDEDLDRIYELYLYQELCNACDCVLTRNGVCSTQAVLDHDHDTHRFRHIICRACNNNDYWKKYFC